MINACSIDENANGMPVDVANGGELPNHVAELTF
jgi:hypothetical protein